MSRGRLCPICGYETYHNEGAFNKCSNCDSVGWALNHPVGPLGKGKGYKCPNCKKATLHDVEIIEDKFLARRCTICNYTLIQPYGDE